MGKSSVKVPRLVDANASITGLSLSPLEGFVLSQIDGRSNLEELSDLTGIPRAEVDRIVEAMIEAKVVEWVVERVSLPKSTGRPAFRTPIDPIKNPKPMTGRGLRRPSSGGITAVRAPAAAPEGRGIYRGASRSIAEDVVDPKRRSSSPSAPRTSHTGSIVPPGQLDEVPGVDEALRELERAAQDLSGGEASSSPPPPADEEPQHVQAPRPAGPAAPKAAEPPADGELDLDPERRKRIDDLYYALDLLDHYQTLGVERGCARKEIRNAYFTLSKVFHPDTMFRKKLGNYKSKMEAIFGRLTEAYEVLGKKKKRAEYDRYLAVQDKTSAVRDIDALPNEELGQTGASAAAAIVNESMRPPASASGASTEPTAEKNPVPTVIGQPQREMSDAGKERARILMAKKLRASARASAHRRRRADSVAPAPVEEVRPDRETVLRQLAGSLKETAVHTGGVDMVKKHRTAARRAEEKGDWTTASDNLRLALAFDPENVPLRADYERVQAALSASLASEFEERALYEQKNGKWAAAAISWAKVFEGRPHDARAARRAAQSLLNANGDLHKAKVLAEAAVELEPEDVQGLTVLARVFVSAKLSLNARRVLERATKLDPDDQIVENLLRQLTDESKQ